MSAAEPVPIPELVDNVRSAILMLERQHARWPPCGARIHRDRTQLEDLGIVVAELATHTAGLVGAFGAIAENHGEIFASARGRKGGRRPKLSPAQVRHARALLEHRDENGRTATTYKEVAESLCVARPTLYRALGSRAPARQ